MKTANFITASAEITMVTDLKKGDVYKRLEESGYSEDKIVHGIVLDVLFNGTDAAIQAMEFKSGYNSLDTEFKVFSGNKDIKIFPSSQEEVKEYLNNCISVIEDEIETKKKAVIDAEEKLKKAKAVVTGDIVKQLSTPTHTNEPLAIEGESTNG